MFSQAIYSIISPGWIITDVFGNNHFLFQSAYFWLSLPITILMSLLPRYLFKAWTFGYMPNDMDIVRWNRRLNPYRELKHVYFSSPLNLPTSMRRSTSRSRPVSIAGSVVTADPRTGSRTDMSTGLRSVHRGFDFATEEGGVAMRRIQSNLSERRQSSRNLALSEGEESKKKSPLRLFSLRSSARRKPATATRPTKTTD
jgi:phospholipid-translocating ATPase